MATPPGATKVATAALAEGMETGLVAWGSSDRPHPGAWCAVVALAEGMEIRPVISAGSRRYVVYEN